MKQKPRSMRTCEVKNYLTTFLTIKNLYILSLPIVKFESAKMTWCVTVKFKNKLVGYLICIVIPMKSTLACCISIVSSKCLYYKQHFGIIEILITVNTRDTLNDICNQINQQFNDLVNDWRTINSIPVEMKWSGFPYVLQTLQKTLSTNLVSITKSLILIFRRFCSSYRSRWNCPIVYSLQCGNSTFI